MTASGGCDADPMPEGDALLWTGFWALVVGLPLLLLWGWALFDLAVRSGEAWWVRLLWALAVVVVPLFGVVAYWLLRPGGDTEMAGPEPVSPEEDG